jgi:hypothetical protein
LRGIINKLNPADHGIIEGEGRSKLPFLYIDVLTRRALAVGQKVTFSIRNVGDRVFAQNISFESERVGRPKEADLAKL